jgi:signal transduction histidine kinase
MDIYQNFNLSNETCDVQQAITGITTGSKVMNFTQIDARTDLLHTIYQFVDNDPDTCYLNHSAEASDESHLSPKTKKDSETERILCNFSHDIKNSLNPIITLFPTLVNKESDPEKLRRMEVIHRNIRNINNLANKTFELIKAKSEEYPLEKTQINISDLMEDVLEPYRDTIEEKNLIIILNKADPQKIFADQRYLKRVLTHIIDNAIRFSSEQGTITIRSQYTPSEFLITITDTGIGMTPYQLQNAFNEFYKGDTSRHSLDSNGLGLAISKYIVQKHGGRIWAESDGMDKGVTIFLTLPNPKEN